MSYVSPKQLYTKEIKRFAMVTLVCIQYLNYLKRLHLIGCIMNYISVTKRPITILVHFHIICCARYRP